MGQAFDEMADHGLGTETGRAADQRFHDAVLDAEEIMDLGNSV